jgi:hypothetical protein
MGRMTRAAIRTGDSGHGNKEENDLSALVSIVKSQRDRFLAGRAFNSEMSLHLNLATTIQC